ncbi:MAG TPA: type IX secretion system sortase PorU [Chitinophagaceae bacterium]|nr:type IX secretion system sortase PorU [Chitinophagaceae bacterium]
MASGVWSKIAVKESGIYKIDLPFLATLGFNTSGISSSSIRLYGNGGNMLSETNADIPIDDLSENAIMVVDGGDGLFNGSDYFLFYAAGPDKWLKDSLNKRFVHQKNIYADSAYYFITIGGVGKRIASLQLNTLPTLTVNSFNERIFHELDTVNLLSSGKEWLGEEFADAPGKTLARSFSVSIPNLITSSPATLISNCVARSINVPSRFDIRINNQLVQQINVPSTGAGFYDLFAQQSQQSSDILLSQESLQVNYTYVPGGFNSQGWVNFFEIHARRNLVLNNSGQLSFRDWNSVGNNICEFVISNATSNTGVWDITDPLSPVKMQGNFSTNEFRFVNDAPRLREYIAFNTANALIPVNAGRVQNQDLHNSQQTDYLIITNNLLISQAERLAAFHRQRNLKVAVVTTDKIFNEFSSGTQDPVAIRDFVKMYFDRYAANPANRPKYLLLFGDASFDYKNRISNNTNLVPAYQSKIFLDPLSTYTSDDFFGFLDDNEDINSGLVTNLLDIGIGRVPAKNAVEAKNYVDKVNAYNSKESFGAWRNNVSFIADDEDNNLHLQDAELITNTVSANPVFNIQKIYLDAFQQESGSAGSRYPTVNETINNQIANGTLVFNFIGHGGSARLAEEVILDQPMINGWNNGNRLPLFVTATCDFAPYDNPFINSIGENILLRPKTGGIAMMTTTRLVFSFSNRLMNNNYMQFAMQPDANGKYKSLGEAVMAAKNYTYQTSGDLINNRKFTLLGDPAMTLAFPQFKIRTTRLNSFDPLLRTDTLSAGEKVTIEGDVTDNNGSLLSTFNGTVYPVIFDKPQTITTKANDPGSQQTSFQQQSNILFKGKASVITGKFSFSFKVPKDINYQYGQGKISYYAEDGAKDGSDFFNGFIIGGSATVIDNDKDGPEIKAWLNDEKFVNGSIVNQRPVLLLKLADSSGINTSGTGIGHDITAMLDNNTTQLFNLNNFYEADLDKYGQGYARFQLPELEPGIHSLKIKAWDVLNNSSEFILEFSVMNDDELVIDHVLNYPNPFTTKTQFWFEHNKPGQDLVVQIHIFSLAGRVVKKIEKTINTNGNRSCEVEWDGKDDFGDKIGRGVYIYRIKVFCSGSKPKTVIEKLVIL